MDVDDIMALAAAWSAAIATRADATPPQDALRTAVAALVAERDALRQDAERYRWLRDKNSGSPE